jgi:uncharacterized zinc-type alcohol dehydrogenase-like protein
VLATPAYSAASATSKLAPFSISRREPGAHDVLIDIAFCGVCHSDIHQARNEWGGSIYPMVPGHEIVGTVAKIGGQVTKWKVGDTVGVGVFVDSCRQCQPCLEGEESYCENGVSETYNSYERAGLKLDRSRPTYGGYSARITVDENYVVRIPAGLPPDRAAPLLCAGITMYSPLRHWGIKAGDKVAIVGLGGLGHVGVKIAHAMGAHVTVLSHTPGKRDDAIRLGADDFVATSEASAFKANARRFDFIVDTVSARHDYNAYLGMLKRDATMVLVGLPDPAPLSPGAVIGGRKRLSGSANGGIRETQEMLDFCAAHKIPADIELIRIDQINDAWERLMRNDVRYRFVIDMARLKKG